MLYTLGKKQEAEQNLADLMGTYNLRASSGGDNIEIDFPGIRQNIEKTWGAGYPEHYAGAQQILDSIEAKWNNTNKTFDDAWRLKESIGNKGAIFKGTDSAIENANNELRRNVYFTLQRQMENQFDKAVPELAGQWANTNANYAALQTAENGLNSRLAGNGSANTLRKVADLPNIMLTGAAVSSSPWFAVPVTLRAGGDVIPATVARTYGKLASILDGSQRVVSNVGDQYPFITSLTRVLAENRPKE